VLTTTTDILFIPWEKQEIENSQRFRVLCKPAVLKINNMRFSSKTRIGIMKMGKYVLLLLRSYYLLWPSGPCIHG